MSNEPGGPAPVPDPSAAPDVAATQPIAPSGREPVAPSGYEAVPTPVAETDPYGVPPTRPLPATPATPSPAPYGQPQPGAYASPAPAPTPYGQPQYGAAQPQYGAPQPQYGQPQYGAPQPQYGAPQYGAPGYEQSPPPYGAQPYGYGQVYGPPQPTDGMAIASFVTSTAGLLFFGGLPGPVGLGLGIAALRRIKVSGKGGRGWAIAGIAIGALGILTMLAIAAYIVFIIVLIGSTGSSSGLWDDLEQGFEEGYDDGASGSDVGETLPDFALRTDLAAGTCLSTYAWEYDMADTEPVDCGVPHEAEVVALVPMTGPVSPDPDDEYDPAFNDAWDACDSLTESLVPDYFSEGNIELYYPHPDDFAEGQTSAYCVYYGDEPGMTGSAVIGTLQLAGAGV